MGGKYDAVLPKLPLRAPDSEARPRQDKVDAVKANFTAHTATALAEEYILMRAEKDAINDDLSAVNLRLEALSQLLVASQQDGADGWGRYGVKDNALRLPSGETIRVHLEPYGKVVDKEAFRLWCIANDYETQLQLWPSRMNAIVKERLVHGEPEPDGTEAAAWHKVVFVKAGEKDE